LIAKSKKTEYDRAVPPKQRKPKWESRHVKQALGQKIVHSMTMVVLSMFVSAIGMASTTGAGSGTGLLFKNGTLAIEVEFPTAPVVGQESLLVLTAVDTKTFQAVEIADSVEVVLWMPSMGHGSAPTQVERSVDAQGKVVTGVFNVKNVHFIMGGDWEVRVTLTDASGAKETASFAIMLKGGGHGGHRPH